MTVDQLPIEQQEATSYCQSCGDVHTADELGKCLACGYRLCFKTDCSSRCACDDARTELMSELDAVLEDLKAEPREAPLPFPDWLREEILLDIDYSLARIERRSADSQLQRTLA